MKYIILVIAVLALVYVIAEFNALVKLRNRVKNQWAQVEVQLKQRFDLIPNLVETVKGCAAYESGTLEAVIKARNAVASASSTDHKMAAEGRLMGALRQMMALAESYPELKANQNFLKLQEQLQELEAKIAYARQFYNDTVMKYQDKRQMFPTSLIAAVFGFKEEAFFEAGENERENVKVSFK